MAAVAREGDLFKDQIGRIWFVDAIIDLKAGGMRRGAMMIAKDDREERLVRFTDLTQPSWTRVS